MSTTYWSVDATYKNESNNVIGFGSYVDTKPQAIERMNEYLARDYVAEVTIKQITFG